MPQLQYLGTLPQKKPYLAEAIRGGVGAYWGQRGMKEAREERGEQREWEREKVERRETIDLKKIDYTKKKQAADLVIKAVGNATPQQREQIKNSQAGELVVDVYGQEAANATFDVGGRGKAGDVALVRTWIATKRKDIMGYPVERSKNDLDTDIALKLKDADWKESYPDLATEFKAAYVAEKKEEKRDGFKWPWQKGDYSKMSEQELYDKSVAGDQQAVAEAKRRGFVK